MIRMVARTELIELIGLGKTRSRRVTPEIDNTRDKRFRFFRLMPLVCENKEVDLARSQSWSIDSGVGHGLGH